MRSIILVTGSSTGIGFLASQTIARAGHVVYVTMRDITTRNASAASDLQRLAQKRILPCEPWSWISAIQILFNAQWNG